MSLAPLGVMISLCENYEFASQMLEVLRRGELCSPAQDHRSPTISSPRTARCISSAKRHIISPCGCISSAKRHIITPSGVYKTRRSLSSSTRSVSYSLRDALNKSRRAIAPLCFRKGLAEQSARGSLMQAWTRSRLIITRPWRSYLARRAIIVL